MICAPAISCIAIADVTIGAIPVPVESQEEGITRQPMCVRATTPKAKGAVHYRLTEQRQHAYITLRTHPPSSLRHEQVSRTSRVWDPPVIGGKAAKAAKAKTLLLLTPVPAPRKHKKCQEWSFTLACPPTYPGP